jgi:hypothetical protein
VKALAGRGPRQLHDAGTICAPAPPALLRSRGRQEPQRRPARFNELKNWRGLATRYDKHALVYRGGLVLPSIVLWLQA